MSKMLLISLTIGLVIWAYFGIGNTINPSKRIEPFEDSHCLKKADNDNAKKVVTACESKFEANKADCNKFLRETANALGITDLSGNADNIISYLEGSPSGWTIITRGEHQTAYQKAKEGNFVVAGLTSTDLGKPNGHVSVITCGDMVHSGMDAMDYPRGYWGVLNGEGKQCEGVNYSFPSPERKKLRYYWKKLP